MRIEHGHCFCGSIAATFTGGPFWICYDHDDDCRRAIGGPLTIWIGYKAEQMVVDRGRLKTFSKTRGVVRSFCNNCGSSIGYVDEGLPEELYICIGFMDAPERFPPEAHGFWRLRLPFIKMDDGLARTDTYTRDRDPSLGLPKNRR